MTFYKSNGDRVPDHILELAEETKAGKMDRREFLALASAFGASTAMAYGHDRRSPRRRKPSPRRPRRAAS